jgi:hypothetical protein
MPCHAMHPMQDYFLEGFLYARQFDMQPICTPMLVKFYFCKKWVLQQVRRSINLMKKNYKPCLIYPHTKHTRRKITVHKL